MNEKKTMNRARSLITSSDLKKLAAIVFSISVLSVVSSCSINPATGSPNLVLMSQAKERAIGLEEHEKVLASMALVQDEELLAYVTEVGNKVASVSHRPDLEYTFTVIDSPEINAFALPGGYVYVNRGLLTYMNSEAELAAVIAHEIGHITARHAVQQQARGKLAQTAATVGGFVTAVATGSGYVGSQISDVASIWAQTGLSGFGRDAELEADSLGAQYVLNAGYDPMAVIEVITVLKNQEDFNKKISNNSGSYHGLFATHPRNDRRLQEAISAVGSLAESQITEVDNTKFRENIDGLIVGQSQGSQSTETRNRYYQGLLGYTVVFPSDWEVSETTTTVTASLAGVGSITIEAQRIQENIEPRLFIRDKMGIAGLQKSEALEQYRLIGHTGISQSSETSNPERIAAIYFGPRVYTFRAEILDPSAVDEIDAQLLTSIRTFRAIQRGEAFSGSEARIKYVQASEFFDFSVVARSSKIANYPEEMLRLLNGYYPTGTPKEGEWIKLVE
ncbi:MAG: peptidase M48 [SAR86 cluster bacterium]|uniref:Peptidase M48 n=1 Tax=SAR86 cluster bacterium TaxID=2030880 RepID=A0A2A5B1Q3_9GAMM|nr:MAG: peptidase M48 [SAR86 cluster bacterium]